MHEGPEQWPVRRLLQDQWILRQVQACGQAKLEQLGFGSNSAWYDQSVHWKWHEGLFWPGYSSQGSDLFGIRCRTFGKRGPKRVQVSKASGHRRVCELACVRHITCCMLDRTVGITKLLTNGSICAPTIGFLTINGKISSMSSCFTAQSGSSQVKRSQLST